jgi:uncharacterized protein (DUF697 family)
MDDHRTQISDDKPTLERERAEKLASMRKTAKETINFFTGIAALIGLVPIPLADAPFIVITQLVMLHKLTRQYGSSLGFSLVLILISAMIGPEIFKAIIKLIPALGSLAGALVAGSCTLLVGQTVLGVLETGQPFTLGNLKNAFVGIFQGKGN